jgi:hypothetical protein
MAASAPDESSEQRAAELAGFTPASEAWGVRGARRSATLLKRSWPYLAQLPFVAWTFAGPLFFGLVLYFRDIAYYYYPNAVFLERSFAQGVWPLWNPTSDAGAPFLATDLVDLVLVRATGALGALRFGPPLHQLIAMCGASWLAAGLGVSGLGMWMAGLGYGLSGYFLSTVNLFQLNHAAAWAPWVIAAWLRLWSSPSPRRIAAAALVAALQVGTLGAEIVIQTALAGLVLLPTRPDRRKLLATGAAALLAFLLAMPALLGVRSLIAGTSRTAGFAPATGFSFSLHPAVLLDAVLPRAFGDVHTFSERGYWGQPFFPDGFPYLLSLYFGPALLWLALRAGRSSGTARLLALAALGVLLALGDHGPLGWLLTPLMRHSRVPVKFMFLTSLALPLLAARGLERARRETLRPAWLAIAAGTLLVALAAATRFWPELPGRLLGGLLPQILQPRAAEVVAASWPASLAAAGAFLLGAALAAQSRSLAPLAGLLVGLDLLIANGLVNLATDPAFYALRPQVSELLREVRAHADARVFAYGTAATPDLRWAPEIARRNRDVPLYAVDRQALLPRSPVLDGLDSAFDEDRAGWAPTGSTLDPRERIPSLFPQHYQRLRLAAVRYVLSFRPLPDNRVSERGQAVLAEVGEPLRLYEIVDPLPRAFTTASYSVDLDPERLRTRLESPGYDPREAVLLSAELPAAVAQLVSGAGASGAGANGAAPVGRSVSVERPNPHELRLRAEGGPGLVVVSEGHHPDWHAYASDGERPLLKASGRYWAIPTRGGGETITVRYQPAWRAPALAALALGALGALALAAWPARR